MKTTRILALPAIAAASLLALTGCFQLPPVGGGEAPTQETGGTSQESGGDTAATDVAGTSWTGDFNGQVSDVAFTLNADGTVDFADWAGDSFDSPADVWSQNGDTLELTVTSIRVSDTGDETFDVTMTGTAADGSMSLSGQGTDGNTYEMTATQN